MKSRGRTHSYSKGCECLGFPGNTKRKARVVEQIESIRKQKSDTQKQLTGTRGKQLGNGCKVKGVHLVKPVEIQREMKNRAVTEGSGCKSVKKRGRKNGSEGWSRRKLEVR